MEEIQNDPIEEVQHNPNINQIGNDNRNQNVVAPILGNDQTMNDYLTPAWTNAPSCIRHAAQGNAHYIFKPHVLNHLPTFHGMESEMPYLHVKEFNDIIETMCPPHQIESARMRLFPFSLKDRAKNWLNNLRPASIHSWDQLQRDFYKKYFPYHKTISLKKVHSKFC